MAVTAAQDQPKQSLATIDLFDGLPADRIKAIEEEAEWHSFAKGDTIVEQNSTSANLMLVASGAVRIVNYSPTGREVAYASFSAGDYIGEIAALDGQPRTAHVVALKPSVIAKLAPESFRDLLLEFPQMTIKVAQRLATIVRAADERILDLSTLSAYERVYRELMTLKREDPVVLGRYLIHPIPTQAQMAASASTTRETVARVLSQLARDGVIEKRDKTIYIRELEALEVLARSASARAFGFADAN
ncbi:MAG: Crp/Fnr family transcriptional regulator [Alphaproteobacteria bacterium]